MGMHAHGRSLTRTSNAEVECCWLEADLATHDLCPSVARRVGPANKVEVAHIFERTKVRTPLGGSDAHEAVVGPFLL
jgi:hypothetical protein